MELIHTKQAEVTIFRFSGRLDSTTAPAIEKEIVAMMVSGAKQFVFDFSTLEYLSSAGIRVLVQCHKKMEQEKGHIILANIPKPIENVLYITGFLPYFKRFPTTTEALAFLSEK